MSTDIAYLIPYLGLFLLFLATFFAARAILNSDELFESENLRLDKFPAPASPMRRARSFGWLVPLAIVVLIGWAVASFLASQATFDSVRPAIEETRPIYFMLGGVAVILAACFWKWPGRTVAVLSYFGAYVLGKVGDTVANAYTEDVRGLIDSFIAWST